MDDRLKSYLAARVRAFRRANGITQADLAAAISRTAEAVSNIERAKSLPSLETILAIANALEAPVREFFPASDSSPRSSLKRLGLEAEATATLNKMTDAQLAIALAQLEALSGLKR